MFGGKWKRMAADLASDRINADRKYLLLELKHMQLLSEWNQLIELINSKGGQEFLDRGRIPRAGDEQFTQAEIQDLITLCHPDKHGGNARATRLTQRLLSKRKG